MNTIIRLREKWDNTFIHKRIWKTLIRVIGAVIVLLGMNAIVSYGRSLTNYPFDDLINSNLTVLLVVGVAFIYYFFPKLGTFIFSIAFALGFAGIAPILICISVVFSWFSMGASEIACMIAVSTPLCMYAIPDSGNIILTIGIAYFIFAVGIYCAGRLGENTWKFAFAVYYTLLGIAFGLYGPIFDHGESPYWGNLETGSMFTSEGDIPVISEMIITMLIICCINIAIVFIVGKLISYDNVRFASIQLDVRDGICFGAYIILMTAAMFGIGNLDGINLQVDVIGIILQTVLAYLVTRPIASFQVSNFFNADMSSVKAGNTAGPAVAQTTIAGDLMTDISSIINIYLNEKKFNNILSVGETPVNGIMLFGEDRLDKKFIVENIGNVTGQNIVTIEAETLIEEFRDDGDFESLEKDENERNLNIVFINHLDIIFSVEGNAKLVEKLCEHFDEDSNNNKRLYIVGVDDVSNVNADCLCKSRISRFYYANPNDSIVYNDTYVVLGLLGKGGSGTVFKAYHKRLKDTVVLKKITDEFSGKVSGRNEVDLLKKIKHMYLPKVYDVFIKNKDIYTVMDFVPGHSFQEIIEKGHSIEEKDLLLWTKQLTDALYYLHSFEPPIIHSDIKPGNIMLTPKGDICLIDFNISSVFGANKKKSAGITLCYSPIEQYGSLDIYRKVLDRVGITLNEETQEDTDDDFIKDGETVLLIRNRKDISRDDTVTLKTDDAEIEAAFREKYSKSIELENMADYARAGLDEKSDIYSLGATLYHLITGTKPALNFLDIKPISSFDCECSDQLAAIIEKSMALNPGDRYETVMDLRRDLDRI